MIIPSVSVLTGNPQQIDLKIGVDVRQGALLINESPYALLVTAGQVSRWIPAYYLDWLPLDNVAVSQLSIVPLLMSTLSNTTSFLFVNVYDKSEPPPSSGSYPMALPRAMSITAGSVTITGTPTVNIAANQSVQISGTPTVNIAANQTVGITGTVTVSVSAGSVTITSGTVNVQNVPSTTLQTAQNQSLLGTLSGTSGNVNITVPSGIHCLTAQLIGGLNPGSLTITGHQSGIVYITGPLPLNTGIPSLALFISAIDSSIDCVWSVGNGFTNVDVVGFYTAQAVDITNRANRLLGQLTNGSTAIDPSKPTPFLVSSDTVQTAAFNLTLAGAASSTLVSAVAGKSVYCLALNFQVTTAAANEVDLQSTNNLTFAMLGTHQTGVVSKPLYGAAPLVGTGVQLHNAGAGAAGQLIGELVYVQK